MNKPLAYLIKLSGLPVQYFWYKKKIYCEDNNQKLRKIKGPALIISNHTSWEDYPLFLYTFMSRHLRTLVGETMYTHSKTLNLILKIMGGIKVDRKNFDFSFVSEMSNCLKKKQVGVIFPEGRLHTPKDSKDMLPFTPSYVYIALKNNVPIIPIYTNGIYGKKKKLNKDCTRLIIGNPIYPNDLYDKNKSEKENISYINNYCKNRIIELSKKLEEMK